ncbi:hypothetical protein J1614_010873 [Plenodomus biglobosus]|nr:hypothetical protein J1614_010873 [Plenodomus biglobosus]
MPSENKKKLAAVSMGLVGAAALSAGVLIAGHSYNRHKGRKHQEENKHYQYADNGNSRSHRGYQGDDRNHYHEDRNHYYSSGHDTDYHQPYQAHSHLTSWSRLAVRRSRSFTRSTSSANHHNDQVDYEVEELSENDCNETPEPAHIPTSSSQVVVPFTGPAVASCASDYIVQTNSVGTSIPPASSPWQLDPVNDAYFYDSPDGKLRTWTNGATTQLKPPNPESTLEWKWDAERKDYCIYNKRLNRWQYYRGLIIECSK